MRDVADGCEDDMANKGAGLRIVALATASVCASAVVAQQAENPLRGAAKMLGFATDVGPPADFVLQSRPKGDLDYIPVFQPPPEPAKKALDAKQLNALKGDLDSVGKRHDAVRRGFPPTAKAMAEEEAAEKAKQKPKGAAQAR